MRADAQENRDRIVAAARLVFHEAGADASLNQIAKRARVGAGTLYRHFPSREDLLQVVMEEDEDREDNSPPGRGTPADRLFTCIESAVTAISRHRGGAAKILTALDHPGSPLHGRGLALAKANAAVVDGLVAEGVLRREVTVAQICQLVCALAAVADYGSLDSEAIRPLVQIVTDGLLAETSPPRTSDDLTHAPTEIAVNQ